MTVHSLNPTLRTTELVEQNYCCHIWRKD